MKIIYTRKMQEILVDDEGYESLNAYSWYLSHYGYAVRGIYNTFTKKGTVEYMHRKILGLSQFDERECDHKDSNRINNQKYNLRIVTHTQNNQNKLVRKDSKTGLKGVTFHSHSGLFMARISLNKKHILLGYFDTKEKAHSAYCVAANNFHKEYANHGGPGGAIG